MASHSCSNTLDHQLVGDPVDTLTGAVFEEKFEFRLTGPLEFYWYRHYDSSKNDQLFRVGWGHTHSFDHTLSFDDDGMRYVAPVGSSYDFPLLQEDGEKIGLHGFLLHRVSAQCYQIIPHGKPTLEFEFAKGQQQARIKRLLKGVHQIQFKYSSNNQLDTIVDSIGRIILVVEDNDGKLISLTLKGAKDKPDKLLIAYQYDEIGNLVATKNGQGNGHTFKYDKANRMLMQRGRKGFTFYYRYDNQGRCTRAMGDDRLQGVVLDYKVPGRLTVVTHPDRGVWQYHFNKLGLLTKIIDPLEGVQKLIYNEAGQLVLEMDCNDNASKVIYDATGAAIAKIDPLGHRTSIPEDPNEPDPLAHRVAGNPAEYEYGRLINTSNIRLPDKNKLQALDLSSKEQSLVVLPSSDEYSKHKDAAFDTPPLGVLWWPDPEHGRVFNDLGKLVQQYDEFGRERRWTYDESGNLEDYFDFDGGKWQYNYPSWHLLKSLTNPIDAKVTFTYTSSEEIDSCLDARGTLSEYRYNQKDYLVEVKRHGVIRETYTRDAEGNLIAKHASDGRELLRFEIGAGNLPIKRTLASGDEHSFQYDEAGRYISASTKKDNIEFAYDSLGDCTFEKRNGLGIEYSFQGWQKWEKSTFFDRFNIQYEWLYNILTITDPSGGSHEIEFHGNGLVERRFSNGSKESSQYDSQGRCLFKSATNNDLKKDWTRRYHWSGEGELLKVEDNQHGVVRHEYDKAHRLSRRHINGRSKDYKMDLADNLIAQPDLEAVTLQDGNRLKTANGFSFEYNDRNHIASKQKDNTRTYYFYDSRDQLIRIEMPEGIWEAEYDALGRRTQKTWNKETTEFYWHDDQLIAEIAHNGKLRLYIYTDPIALTPLLFIDYDSIEAIPESGKVYFIFSDQIGTPRAIEDIDGIEVWSAEIAPYGQAHIKDSSIEFNIRFSGHYFDAEIDLHYNRFRHYDSLLGRYIQSDPWGIAGGFNLYAYSTNPLLDVDVRGLGEEGGDSCNKPGPDEEGTSKSLKDMDDNELKTHVESRAQTLKKALEQDSNDAKGTTLSVGVVQKGNDKTTRKVVVTTSNDDQKIPKSVTRAMKPGEETRSTKPTITRSERYPNPDYDPNKPQDRRNNPKTKTDPMIVNQETGKKESYTKAKNGEPVEGTQHHAEQRMENGATENGETVLTQQPTKKCCPGCTKVLGDSDNLSKIPNPEMN